MNILLQLIIIFHISGVSRSFEDLSDVNRMSLYLNKNDKLRVDLRKLMSFQSTSINFWSNNPSVLLPGVSGHTSHISEPKRKFTPIHLKNKDGYVFIVESENPSVVLSLKFESEFELKAYDNKFVNKNPNAKFVIADLHIDEYRLSVLTYETAHQENPDKTNRNSRYSIFNVNFREGSQASIVHFDIPWCEKPTLKVLSPSGKVDDRIYTFLIFDKELFNPKNTFTHQKSFSLVNVDFALADDVVNPENIKVLSINQLLFSNKNDKITLKNIMITSKTRHQIFFFIQNEENKSTNRNSVYSCLVEYKADLKTLKFNECQPFKVNPLKQFFLKSENYITIDMTNKMNFCNVITEYCKEGTLQESWELKSVLLENDSAVIIMSIEKTKSNCCQRNR